MIEGFVLNSKKIKIAKNLYYSNENFNFSQVHRIKTRFPFSVNLKTRRYLSCELTEFTICHICIYLCKIEFDNIRIITKELLKNLKIFLMLL